MNIITDERPPIYDACVARFPGADVAHAIFSFGDRIYNLSGQPLTPALLAHEMVHCAQQTRKRISGIGEWTPELWWERYLFGPLEFRLEEELIAHAAEFRVMVMGGNRHVRRAALSIIATRLAGPLYGRIISLADAKRQILGRARG